MEAMPGEPTDEPTQKTQKFTDEDPIEIPVPSKGQIMLIPTV